MRETRARRGARKRRRLFQAMVSGDELSPQYALHRKLRSPAASTSLDLVPNPSSSSMTPTTLPQLSGRTRFDGHATVSKCWNRRGKINTQGSVGAPSRSRPRLEEPHDNYHSGEYRNQEEGCADLMVTL